MDENSAYQELFFEEADTYLRALNDDILKLEKNPEDLEVMHAIFRSAHTLKGMAATMGYDTMAKLTHLMESVLNRLQQGDIPVTYDIITVIFNCLDTLSAIVEDLRQGGTGELEVADLVAELTQLTEGDVNELTAEGTSQEKLTPRLNHWEASDQKVIAEGTRQGYNSYVIAVRFDEEAKMKSARALILMNQLEAAGDLILSEPSVEELETGDFDTDINILYLTKLSAKEVEAIVFDVTDVLTVALKDAQEVTKHTSKKTEKKNHESKGRKRQTIRVDLKRLDQFMNLVSELVIHRSRLETITSDHQIPEVNDSLEQVERITSQLQDVVLQLRMQPFRVAVQRFPRMIRDLSNELDKKLRLEIEGEDTELDRTVVTELGEPLVHLLRNAADHGVEKPAVRIQAGKAEEGVITVGAHQVGNQVVVTVADDGKGMDPQAIRESAEKKGIATDGLTDEEAIQLIFHPGFSTKKEVTDVSGRGVGMDVVREKINNLNGSIEIESELGKGSTFSITLPLTLSIIQSLLVKAGSETFALPQTAIEKVEVYKEENISRVHELDVYSYNGEFIPVTYLSKHLDLKPNTKTMPYILIASARNKHYAVVVDGLLGQQEIVIKDLGTELESTKEYLGATILGDGDVVLIVDLNTLYSAERGTQYGKME